MDKLKIAKIGLQNLQTYVDERVAELHRTLEQAEGQLVPRTQGSIQELRRLGLLIKHSME